MIKFFILAAGYGDRAVPLSLVKPKPLFPLHGKPLIEILLKQLKDLDLKSGFINLHYKHRLVKKSINIDININYLYEEELSGSKILRESINYLDDFLLIINGDVFLNIPIRKMVRKVLQTNSDGVLLIRKSSRSDCPSIKVKGDKYLGRKKWEGRDDFMYTGVSLLKKDVLKKIDDINFFDTLSFHNFKIRTLTYDGIWLDIGEPGLYFEANFKYKNYINDYNSNSVSENVTISSDSIVKDSIIWENSVIDNNSIISNSIVVGNLRLSNVNYNKKIITKDRIFEFNT